MKCVKCLLRTFCPPPHLRGDDDEGLFCCDCGCCFLLPHTIFFFRKRPNNFLPPEFRSSYLHLHITSTTTTSSSQRSSPISQLKIYLIINNRNHVYCSRCVEGHWYRKLLTPRCEHPTDLELAETSEIDSSLHCNQPMQHLIQETLC